jgi:hypothetical protein
MCCPACKVASEPTGKAKVLIGHGLVSRQVRGPLEVGGATAEHVLMLRRYLCLACGHTHTVGPCGLVRRRYYSGQAIALVLALLASGPAVEARRRVATAGRLDRTGLDRLDRWSACERWVEAARRGELFPRVGRHDDGLSRRAVAERTALWLAGRVGLGPGFDLAERAFAGAALAA